MRIAILYQQNISTSKYFQSQNGGWMWNEILGDVEIELVEKNI